MNDPINPPTAQPLQILVIEDSPDDLDLLTMELRRGLHFEHEQVCTESALRTALPKKNWHLIISDYNMPNFSGMNALKIVKEMNPDVPFILLSGSLGEDRAVEALKSGAADFINKDNLARLLPAIKRELKAAADRRQQREDEIKLRQSEENLRQSQKLDALGRLGGGIAHDFNNILASILLNADSLSDKIAPQDPLSEKVSEIVKAAERGASLVKQLLVFSRRHEATTALTDLNKIILKMKKMLDRLIGDNIELTADLSTEVSLILIDPSRLEQVIMNLVLNARDAIGEQGKIRIHTMITDYLGKAHVEFSVADTGSGMSAETRSKIFEPFFTTKGLEKGTGLGLSIVYGVVKDSQGAIEVESEIGKGTTFRLFFPKNEDSAQVPEPVLEASIEPSMLNISVLLVEDDEAIRKSIRSSLQEMGCVVHEASNGVEALEVQTSTKIDFKLLISDIRMPKMSGTELMKKLRETLPTIKVLLISGFTQENPKIDTDPNTTFLAKPFKHGDLKQALMKIM